MKYPEIPEELFGALYSRAAHKMPCRGRLNGNAAFREINFQGQRAVMDRFLCGLPIERWKDVLRGWSGPHGETLIKAALACIDEAGNYEWCPDCRKTNGWDRK